MQDRAGNKKQGVVERSSGGTMEVPPSSISPGPLELALFSRASSIYV